MKNLNHVHCLVSIRFRFTAYIKARLYHTWLISLVVAIRIGAAEGKPSDGKLEFDVETEYYPNFIELGNASPYRQIGSIHIQGMVPAAGDGQAEIQFDNRPAVLNEYGDVVTRAGPTINKVPVVLKMVLNTTVVNESKTGKPGSNSSPLDRIYELVLPENTLERKMRFVLSEHNFFGPKRMVVMPNRPQSFGQKSGRLLLMTGFPPRITRPDLPLGTNIDLYGHYLAMDGNLRGIGLTGLLGGPGQLVLDPNDISYEDFRGLYSTFGGFSRLPVEIRREIISDPLQRDRQLYQIISSNPQNTNRCYLVTCPTEAGRHKMLLYQGHKLMIIVPMVSRKSKEDNSATPRRQAPPDATTAMRNSCRANLRQLEGAKEIWALENHKKIGDLITLQDLVPHYIKAAPVCPAGGQYALNVLGQEPACTVPGHRYNE